MELSAVKEILGKIPQPSLLSLITNENQSDLKNPEQGSKCFALFRLIDFVLLEFYRCNILAHKCDWLSSVYL